MIQQVSDAGTVTAPLKVAIPRLERLQCARTVKKTQGADAAWHFLRLSAQRPAWRSVVKVLLTLTADARTSQQNADELTTAPR
jgi:hypothetical protein